MKWLLIANGAVFLLCLMLWGALALLLWQKDQERDAISRQSAKLGASLNAEQINDVNRKKFIKKVVDQNVKVNNFLVKLGSATKNDMWLEKIQLDASKEDVPFVIQIDGKAINLEEVNQVLSPLNTQLENGTLEVSNAAPETSPDGQAYYTWTIQNKADAAAGAAGGSPVPGTSPVPVQGLPLSGPPGKGSH